MAEEAFGEGEVARAVEELWIRWDQVEEMAVHPLVTIGAHTVTHPILRDLPREAARVEMVESRRRLEARLGQPVHHFAYPHGSPAQVGEREYALARECGFTTAVTTRLANVMPGSADHLECLPRIYGESLRELELGLSGVVSAFRYRGRRVVTV
ncbi:MAG: polysaccharide deacetylase family protein [Minicystis sp.]